VFGEPGHAAQQRTILRDSLAALRTVTEPGGIVELPYRWKRGTYEEADAR
jgi:D-proline reductase (dithiol) PrdB